MFSLPINSLLPSSKQGPETCGHHPHSAFSVLLNSPSPEAGNFTPFQVTQDPSAGHSTLAQAQDLPDILPYFFPSTDMKNIHHVLILPVVPPLNEEETEVLVPHQSSLEPYRYLPETSGRLHASVHPGTKPYALTQH